MLKEATCCFTGHRILEKDRQFQIQKQLEICMKALIEEGFVRFCSGGALGFDLLAAQTVLKLKKTYPQIQLFMALPCRDQDKLWRPKERDAYHQVLHRADEIVYTAEDYYNGCMFRRNRYMVDQSDCMIAYMTRLTGGTKYTVEYAQKNGVPILFLETA